MVNENDGKELFSNFICATETSREVNEMKRCFSIYNQLWRLLSAIVSLALASFVPLCGWKVCVCAHEDEVEEKKNWLWKKKGENREEFAFTTSLFKFPLPSPRRKKVGGGEKNRKQRRRIWRIRGPDWVSNKYSEKQSVLTLFPSWPGYALKESDNFAAQ